MTQIAANKMTPDAWREYCTLKRRMEWLEISNTDVYRRFPSMANEVDTRYSDVSGDIKDFGSRLARS